MFRLSVAGQARGPAPTGASGLWSLVSGLWLLVSGFSSAEINVEATLSSRFLLAGERAHLLVTVDGEVPERAPRIPEVPGLTIVGENGGRPRPVALAGRRIGYAFSFSVLSYDLGAHTIPEFTVDVAGHSYPTRPIDLEIFSHEELAWTKAAVGGDSVRCGAAFRIPAKMPFVNQSIPVELKVYVPYDLRVEDWGIPDFQRDGVTAWRFEPNRSERNKVVIKGVSYAGVAYPSTLTPTRSGKVSIGPARLRFVVLQLLMDSVGYRPREFTFWIDIPAMELDARPLPPGAPDGFSNAVGTFDATASTPDTEVHEGDPVVVNLRVSGTGNLDSIQPPVPVEAEGWKLYEATPMPRGEERRKISGAVSFRQFMRPLGLKSRIPPFRFVFFDPEAEEYRTLLTNPIPLTILPSTHSPNTGTAPPPEAAVPVERMTDILGVVDTGPLSEKKTLPWRWLWQILPAAIFLALLARIAWRKIAPQFHHDPVKARRNSEFRQLHRAPGDSRSFYRAAGAFVERWFGAEIPDDPDLARILAERDQHCFVPEDMNEKLPTPERRRILRTLRRHLALLALLAAMLPAAQDANAQSSPWRGSPTRMPPTLKTLPLLAEVADSPFAPSDTSDSSDLSDRSDSPSDAYARGRFAEAARIWLQDAPFEQLDATRLFNIGNCWYRLGSPGQAALYYRRALLDDPTHSEARQNLRFLERKFGSLTIKRPEYQILIARLPLAFWQGLLWAGAWMLAIGWLCFPATHPGSGIRVAAVAALVLAPVLAGLGGLGWHYFPDDAEFAPPAERAVVVADNAVAYTDATRTSPEIIDAPPGSLCRIIAQRGRWTYVAFATRTRGWLPSEQVEPIIPKSPPKPPADARPRATDSST